MGTSTRCAPPSLLRILYCAQDVLCAGVAGAHRVEVPKYKAGQTSKKIFEDLNGAVSYRTIKRWRKMIRKIGAIDLPKPSACHRTVHTKAPIQKIKRKSKGGKRISCRKLAFEMDMSFSSAYRILEKDFKMKPYKKTVEPLLKDEHKAQRKKFANWARKKLRKEDTMRILFSNEKMFDLGSIYNSENDRIWAVNREEANRRGGKKTARKVSTKSDGMVRGRCDPCSV